MTDGGADYREIDRWEGGAGWIAHPDETMQRASHAVATDDGVWVIDPVDVDGIDELFAGFGEVAGVVTLLDRHKRDAATVADRHGVAVHVPGFMDGVADALDAPVEPLEPALDGTGYACHELVDNRFWQEAALYGEDTGALYVPEAVGTAPYFLACDEVLGVHPMLRLTPPAALAGLEPDRIMVGHGAGVAEDATAALRDALDGARRRAPSLYVGTLKHAVLG